MRNIKSTEWMTHPRWEADRRRFECLFCRAICPGDLVRVNQNTAKEELEAKTFLSRTGSLEATLRQNGGQAFTDGAGGPTSICDEIRQTGSGIAAFHIDPPFDEERLDDDPVAFPICVKNVSTMSLRTPGRQTVPRAEASAVTELMERVPAGLVEKVGIDASYVVRGLAAGTPAADDLQRGANGDLWERLLSSNKPVGHKVVSHLTLDQVATGETTFKD